MFTFAKIIAAAILTIATLGLSGCIVVPANGYGQTAGVPMQNYQHQQGYQNSNGPCGNDRFVGYNQQGQAVCSRVNGQGGGLPPGCVRTIYGTSCNQADGYQLQSPMIPPPMRRMSVGGGENDTDVPMIIET